MKLLRGSLALLFCLLLLILGDPVQRFVIAPMTKLFPSKRIAILSRWQHVMRWISLSPIIYIGGARFPRPPAVPGDEGVLVLMNHQSIFDIPLVVQCLPVTTYARFITRKRYFKWIPTVSHLVRLYQYPSVNPRANTSEMKKGLIEIRDTARKADVPLCIFPEGTRTKDGEIGPFRRTGLQLILKQRPWKVYVLVGDGYWKAAKLKDFVGAMSTIRGKLEVAGVFDWTDPKQNSEDFIEEIRQVMVERLAQMRQVTPA